jgi:steroid delta-isomerase-like uncharacterized protein
MADPGDVMKRWFRAIDQNDVELALSLCSEDVEWVAPTAAMKGREEIRPFFAGFTGGFPDSRFDVKRVITSGSTVIAEGNYVGTHTGPFRNPAGEIPATRKRVVIPFASVAEVEGDEITALRVYWDEMGFMNQLGVPGRPPR